MVFHQGLTETKITRASLYNLSKSRMIINRKMLSYHNTRYLKIIFLYKIILLLSLVSSKAQTTSSAGVVAFESILSLRPADIFYHPDYLINLWTETPLPLSYYDEEDIARQKMINEIVSDAVVVYSPVGSESEWTGIDREEITPYTWKWVYLDLSNGDGTVIKVSLRRPNKWIEAVGAMKAGERVYLDLPEMGAQGWAIVTGISSNQLDTRLWEYKREGDYITRPVTGKFIHESDNVYRLYFEGNLQPLSVTGNHPLWSIDRSDWVAAEELVPGDRIKSLLGSTKLVCKERVPGIHAVYNLEVYRDHNYLVSQSSVLAHNTCLKWDAVWREMRNTKASRVYSEVGRLYYRLYTNWDISRFFFDLLIEQALERGTRMGAKHIELRFGKTAVASVGFEVPKGGKYKGFYVTYDEKEGVLSLSNRENLLDLGADENYLPDGWEVPK